MPILPREEWPMPLQEHLGDHVAGVFVGGCVVRGDGSRFRRRAHAHTQEPNKGWICYLSRKRLGNRTLAYHELAHLVSGEGHTDKWRAAMRRLCGKADVAKRRRGRRWARFCMKCRAWRGTGTIPGTKDPHTMVWKCVECVTE